MKKFQELLTKDLGWKLLSIAIAATMWFMVINIIAACGYAATTADL